MQNSKKILIIQGNPDVNSFSEGLARAYKAGAEKAGHTVTLITLGELEFSPVLQYGYKQRTSWEPALETAWEAINGCDHMVWVYPTWWGTMPALVKGFIDRMFLPGKTFQYRKGSIMWDKLLKGKTGRLITTMDSPVWYNQLVYRSSGHRAMKTATLEFCGVKPVKVTTIGRLRWLTEEQRAKWLQKAAALGQKAC